MTSINNLIGSFTENDSVSLNDDNVESICIDTSNNRIGINTLNPEYSIHVSGGEVKSKSLIVDDISCLDISCQKLYLLNITVSGDSTIKPIKPLEVYLENGFLKMLK